MTFDQVVDSGERHQFDSGSVRDVQKGKGRYDLISPIAMRRLAAHYENGAEKYGDHNWRLGQPLVGYYNSTMRHLMKWLMGWKDEDHLAAALWNIAAIIDTEEMIARGKLPKTLDARHEMLMDDESFIVASD